MIHTLINIVKNAGNRILEEYEKPVNPDFKADDSPLTLADIASNKIICESLLKSYPDIPILSEEGKLVSYSTRKKWNRFWCVDPLDGTKEFVKKTGQFTINIALIEGNEPVLGIIYAPVLNLYYYAEKGKGSFKSNFSNSAAEKIQVAKLDHSKPRVVASKDHAGPKVEQLMNLFPGCELKSMGSSLKFCLVAEGEADIYLRDVPTFEWDTAAAQIIVEEAGGFLFTQDAQRLTYNKENLLNPQLVTIGANPTNWNNHLKSISFWS